MDPREKRVGELSERVRTGVATDAEREELALYADEDPQITALAKRAEHDEKLGKDWLARANADQKLVASENTTLTKAERSIGVGLVVAGGIGMFFFPPAALGLVAGGALLTWSVLRVGVKNFGKDPYKDIEQ